MSLKSQNRVIFHALWAQELQHFVWYHRDSSSGGTTESIYFFGHRLAEAALSYLPEGVISIPDAAA